MVVSTTTASFTSITADKAVINFCVIIYIILSTAVAATNWISNVISLQTAFIMRKYLLSKLGQLTLSKKY